MRKDNHTHYCMTSEDVCERNSLLDRVYISRKSNANEMLRMCSTGDDPTSNSLVFSPHQCTLEHLLSS